MQIGVLPMIRKKHVIALGGPDLKEYLNLFPKSVETISIWERNPMVFQMQVEKLSSMVEEGERRVITLNTGDIIQAPVHNRYFYDLDFCQSIKNAEAQIRRFRHMSFMVTLCPRGSNIINTIEEFLRIVEDEDIINHVEINRTTDIIITSKNTYTIYRYRGKSPMISINKL
jgi:hypothetical protein